MVRTCTCICPILSIYLQLMARYTLQMSQGRLDTLQDFEVQFDLGHARKLSLWMLPNCQTVQYLLVNVQYVLFSCLCIAPVHSLNDLPCFKLEYIWTCWTAPSDPFLWRVACPQRSAPTPSSDASHHHLIVLRRFQFSMQISSKRSRLEQQKASKNGEGSGKYETGVGLVLMCRQICWHFIFWHNVGQCGLSSLHVILPPATSESELAPSEPPDKVSFALSPWHWHSWLTTLPARGVARAPRTVTASAPPVLLLRPGPVGRRSQGHQGHRPVANQRWGWEWPNGWVKWCKGVMLLIIPNTWDLQ